MHVAAQYVHLCRPIALQVLLRTLAHGVCVVNCIAQRPSEAPHIVSRKEQS
jgi:hypothetical protein